MFLFSDLDLCPQIQKAIEAAGYKAPTPIQEQAIPHLLKGRDLLGIAQTGTGKTAAFALPILDYFYRQQRGIYRGLVRCLILTPTRELAAQIADSFDKYGRNQRFRLAVVFGGVGQHKQVNALSRGVDVLVATPGRLLDLMNQGFIKLNELEIFVLDEADRMLDMGFIHDVRKVIDKLPAKRQSLLFSATMPGDIANLAKTILIEPVRVAVTPPATTVDTVEQKVMFVEREKKSYLLTTLLRNGSITTALVFTRTKYGADKLARYLYKSSISADSIHGNKSQNAREHALHSFRTGKIQVLVATDIAARGIDVPGVSHVINFDIPNEAESYVHRIGRTARAGLSGIAISFCDVEEKQYLLDIQKLTGVPIQVIEDHPFHSEAAAKAMPAKPVSQGRSAYRSHGFTHQRRRR
ncbi:MAG: DEAD/DEAH box helicase [Candidatus Wallbacteria bacterium]|nr:DEAD/DEAH box helicase [Candidatus Wallbacteria bacterium]